MQEKENKVISDFLKSLGFWREHVVIGGGYALFIYKLYLADQELKNYPVATSDIDSLIRRNVPEISKKNIAKHLQEAGFTHIFKDLDSPPTEAYVKEIDGLEVEVEFLTDSASRRDKNKNVHVAGVVAQPLSYLSLSLEASMKFETHSGERGFVVSPSAWLFHKGLTFNKRGSLLKKLKDLYGIWFVATQLGDFSKQAIHEFNSLARQNSRWYNTFRKNLHTWIENASPADWSKLETQDPSGNLKSLAFKQIIKNLNKGL